MQRNERGKEREKRSSERARVANGGGWIVWSAQRERERQQTAEATRTVGEAKGDTTGASPRDTQVGVAPIPTRVAMI